MPSLYPSNDISLDPDFFAKRARLEIILAITDPDEKVANLLQFWEELGGLRETGVSLAEIYCTGEEQIDQKDVCGRKRTTIEAFDRMDIDDVTMKRRRRTFTEASDRMDIDYSTPSSIPCIKAMHPSLVQPECSKYNTTNLYDRPEHSQSNIQGRHNDPAPSMKQYCPIHKCLQSSNIASTTPFSNKQEHSKHNMPTSLSDNQEHSKYTMPSSSRGPDSSQHYKPSSSSKSIPLPLTPSPSLTPPPDLPQEPNSAKHNALFPAGAPGDEPPPLFGPTDSGYDTEADADPEPAMPVPAVHYYLPQMAQLDKTERTFCGRWLPCEREALGLNNGDLEEHLTAMLTMTMCGNTLVARDHECGGTSHGSY